MERKHSEISSLFEPGHSERTPTWTMIDFAVFHRACSNGDPDHQEHMNTLLNGDYATVYVRWTARWLRTYKACGALSAAKIHLFK